MKALIHVTVVLSSILATITPFSSHAHEKGEFFTRLGTAFTVTSGSSDTVLNIPGTEVETGNDTTLSIFIGYKLSDHLGLEFLTALPPKYDLSLSGKREASGALDGTSIGSVRVLPPVLALEYYPLNPYSKIQPYVGVGINYTVFFDEKVDGEIEQVSGGDEVKFDVDSSWGVAVGVGVDYEINNNLMFNGSFWAIKVKTTANLKVAGQSDLPGSDVDLDLYLLAPTVGITYKF